MNHFFSSGEVHNLVGRKQIWNDRCLVEIPTLFLPTLVSERFGHVKQWKSERWPAGGSCYWFDDQTTHTASTYSMKLHLCRTSELTLPRSWFFPSLSHSASGDRSIWRPSWIGHKMSGRSQCDTQIPRRDIHFWDAFFGRNVCIPGHLFIQFIPV